MGGGTIQWPLYVFQVRVQCLKFLKFSKLFDVSCNLKYPKSDPGVVSVGDGGVWCRWERERGDVVGDNERGWV